MRTQSHPSLRDVPDDLPECNGMCVSSGGLCCPDDPLHLVLHYFSAPAPAPHETSLAALEIGGSLRRQEQPPPPFGWDQKSGLEDVPVLDAKSAPGGGGGDVWYRASRGLSSYVPEYMEYLVDHTPDGGSEAAVCSPSCKTGAMPASGSTVSNVAPPLLAPMSAGGGLHAHGAPLGDVSGDAPPVPAGTFHACRALDGVVSSDAPLLQAHAPPSACTPPTCTSSGCLTPTTSEIESPAPVWQPLAWAVQRKRQRLPVKCRNRPWSLDFPLHAVPVAPLPDNPGDNNDDAKNTCHNARAIRRRRLAPRQRNREVQRVCSHCHSPDTPQWRAGPDGPGTLCNACGIRYAANKLLPEYRPSTSPSFRSDQHSNRHRKVVKLREQKAKETLEVVHDPAPASSPMLPKRNESIYVCTYMSIGL
ncbi:hypothetical protein BAE44_0010679 [Dichanthelium oligosanthes]|uniref:GATA-type domain-containing protein n=1 Tax=Dichanthelium oligosanthes TaxID=888268 RepID=A0A1E5VT90_9POAL|nr:hypothetical protein BAE44_0010679 [Dichanthelium oligosanthes]